jgi:hypothetical protein
MTGAAALAVVSIGCTNGHGASDSTTSTPRPITVAAPITGIFPTAAAPSATPTNEKPRVTSIPQLEPEQMDPGDLAPRRLKLELASTSMEVIGLSSNRPHVSDDGSTAIVLVDSEGGVQPQILLIRPLDGKTPESEIPLLNETCPWTDIKCRRPKAEKQVVIANKFLAKHRWVKFQVYVPDQPSTREPGCGKENRDRHFRIPGFDVSFESTDPEKAAHLRIVRDDGAVVTDSYVDVHVPGESEECIRGTMPYINDLGFELARRAMYVELSACWTKGCPSGLRFLFFRLPPPLPK